MNSHCIAMRENKLKRKVPRRGKCNLVGGIAVALIWLSGGHALPGTPQLWRKVVKKEDVCIILLVTECNRRL